MFFATAGTAVDENRDDLATDEAFIQEARFT